MTDATFEQSRDFVQSLARGLAVLRCVSANGGSATLPGIARRSGLSRAATRRLVLTLEHLGYLRANGREFDLLFLVEAEFELLVRFADGIVELHRFGLPGDAFRFRDGFALHHFRLGRALLANGLDARLHHLHLAQARRGRFRRQRFGE